jgi:FkbM family methyltransferase
VPIGFTTRGAVRFGSRVQKLLGILREPVYRRALRHGVAASIEHEAIPLRTDFRTVIDVGANRGQFALFAAHHFPGAKLICFEPQPAPRALLKRVIDGTAPLRVLDVAVGASNEVAEFHIAEADDSSSLLMSNQRQQRAFPGAESNRSISVEIRRLDEVLTSSDLVPPVLLKIDVQGGELGVLRGAQGLLGSIDVVLLEASFVELYVGQALVDELWTFLNGHGFTCRGIWSATYGTTGECLLADLLFARRGFEPLAI